MSNAMAVTNVVVSPEQLHLMDAEQAWTIFAQDEVVHRPGSAGICPMLKQQSDTPVRNTRITLIRSRPPNPPVPFVLNDLLKQ